MTFVHAPKGLNREFSDEKGRLSCPSASGLSGCSTAQTIQEGSRRCGKGTVAAIVQRENDRQHDAEWSLLAIAIAILSASGYEGDTLCPVP